MTEHLDRLLDPDEWASTIDAIREMVDLPIDDTKLDRNINHWIVEPLNEYIQCSFEKAGNRHHTGTIAATNLLNAVEDIVYELKHGQIHPAYISIMDDKWREWQSMVCYSYYIKYKMRVQQGGEKALRRNDALKVVMRKILDKNGDMTASQLWAHFKAESAKRLRNGEDLYRALYPEIDLEIEFTFDPVEDTLIERRIDKRGVTTTLDRKYETFRKIVSQAKKMVS